MKKIKITKIELNDYVKKRDVICKQIKNRIEYIIYKIFQLFNKNKLNSLQNHIGDNFILENVIYNILFDKEIFINEFYSVSLKGYSPIIIYKGEELYIDDSFPVEWLFEDFEKDLINGKKLYDLKIKKLNDKKDKMLFDEKMTVQKNKDYVKSAWKKLTKEEKFAIESFYNLN